MEPFNGTLTDEHLALIAKVRDEWVEIALSTERCDRAKAEEAVKKLYEVRGFKVPELFVWQDSPMGGIQAAAALQAGIMPEDPHTADWAALAPKDKLSSQIGLDLSPWRDAYWLALLTCALPIAGMDPSAELDAAAAAVKEIGWWWPMTEAVVMTERPTLISRDKEGRLHNENGPALDYADGYALWAWHGTRVPKGLIMGEWTISDILNERNTEIRRCAIEARGWDKFIEEANLAPVGNAVPDPGNAPFTIQLFDLPEQLSDMYEERARILLCTNGSEERDGTRHRFGLVVPGHHDDPVAAAADLYGIPRQAYANLEVRR